MKFNDTICRVRAEIDGVKYEPGPIKASEADRIQQWTGYSVREWEAQLTAADPTAARGLIALTRYRQGENAKMKDIEIDDVDSISADLYDLKGRLVDVVAGDDGKPLLVGGKLVLTFDGEREDGADPTPAG